MARWMRWTLVGVVVYLATLGWWIARPITDTLPLFGEVGTEQEGMPLLTDRGVEIGAEYDCGPLWSSRAAVLVEQPVPGALGRVPCELPRSQQRQLFALNVLVLVAVGAGAGVFAARRRRHTSEVQTSVRSSSR
jgi:hypothetical protein